MASHHMHVQDLKGAPTSAGPPEERIPTYERGTTEALPKIHCRSEDSGNLLCAGRQLGGTPQQSTIYWRDRGAKLMYKNGTGPRKRTSVISRPHHGEAKGKAEKVI